MLQFLRILRWFARAVDAVVDVIGRNVAWLVLFVVATLFGQWPLREFLGAGHILANDFESVKKRSSGNDGRSMLVVVENWNGKNFCKLCFDIEALWGFDVF